ncbi:MAG: hypothetical protein GX537_09780 [Actinobacteria bacterium]|nr:hypothetical protein [Actinomycetota bacterium]
MKADDAGPAGLCVSDKHNAFLEYSMGVKCFADTDTALVDRCSEPLLSSLIVISSQSL